MRSHDNEPDIEVLHHAVLREQQEPYEGDEPIPRWMMIAGLLLLAFSGWYLGHYDAQFDSDIADMRSPAFVRAYQHGAQSEGTASAAGAVAAPDGAQIYASRCVACHQASGQGLAGLAPPLANSPYVLDDETRMLKIILSGLTGPIEVNGGTWNGAMPAWGPSMSDAEIAAVATHIRSSWGNQAAAVTEDAVKTVRETFARSTPWTVPEL